MNENTEFKVIEFDESKLKDLQSLAGELLGDENDPRSYNYKRTFVRPDISWLKVALNVLIPLAVAIALSAVLRLLGAARGIALLVTVILLLVYMLLTAKRSIICCIRIYQRYAPESVRNKCRFEPTCSEYMALALQKYGLFKGLAKGIDRLKRCNPQNGGFDYP